MLSDLSDRPYKHTGDIIREYRKLSGHNRSEFARRVGIDRVYVYRIEKGQAMPHVLTLSRIAQALRMPDEVLMEAVRDDDQWLREEAEARAASQSSVIRV